jgi:Protein of unknown function (DUF2865)
MPTFLQRLVVRWHVSAALAVLVGLLSPQPVAAQGLLEQLFGSSSPKPAATALQPRSQTLKPISSSLFATPREKSAEPAQARESSGGTYRTLCVRMCDGYYVPISFSTRRDNFMQDQLKCRSTCGGDAQIFYHRNPGAAVEDAVDLSGRPYSRLPNAFRFRKARVDGCACRPPPWSEAELARHQSYASASTNLSSARLAQAPVTQTAAGKTIASAAAPVTAADPAPAPVAGESRPSKMASEQKAGKPAKVTRIAKADVASAADATLETPVKVPGGVHRPATAQKYAGVERRARPQVQKVAAAPQPPQSYGGGLFGSGLTSQPKLKWPGD